MGVDLIDVVRSAAEGVWVSLKDLRGLLGDNVRVAIDVSDNGARGVIPRCVVAAHWTCGCAAEGTSFSDLQSTMCDVHAGLAPAA